jgi:hypothetical protein
MLTNTAAVAATMLVSAGTAEIGASVPVSAEFLETLVQRRLGTRIRGLRVIVHEDGIMLQGVVSTYHAKQLAQHAAMDLTDLPILANDIEVR